MATGMHVAVSGMTGQPVVVLLHCMGRSGTMRDRHRTLLAERFRVLAPDLPGHGKPAGPVTVQGTMTAVASALSRACGDKPAHLAGLSLGARAGLKLAAERNTASLALPGCGLSFPRRSADGRHQDAARSFLPRRPGQGRHDGTPGVDG